ncbi:MAG TPA: hypothetical protein ENF48_05005 [Desulfobacteraceae bacterium]|nr:hypothetical protein [Deltaproteobacteria bacterium]RLB94431.1 MAG: hypothetical protein DRH76_09240 [Deltaproteobacteria bacterium]HDI59706.1 hypothetical protein [Desulfobacteraceae bacterium]
MPLEKKTVTCQCGATYQIDKPSHWCTACGRQIFYSEGARRRHRWDTYYVWGALLSVIAFLVYIFIEMIAVPLVGRGG